MDEHLGALSAPADGAERSDFADQTALEEASAGFVGRWHRLISTTNWEKGRIISEWRERLAEAGAPATACGDEAWSRRVGGVSPQHVGRLRRVCQRFGMVHAEYPRLYWSHFQAAVDWHDAEMWLEGAVQSGWSVARMRAERWQAMGSPADQAPREDEIVAAELDEDCDPAGDSAPETIGGSVGEVHGFGIEPGEGATDEGSGFGVQGPDAAESLDGAPTLAPSPQSLAPGSAVRPFENLPALPPDLADALEALKLAILNHKLSGWKEVSLGDVLAMLDALKELAAAPA
jgi:hypothetical protein